MLFGGRRSRYGVLARKSWSQILKVRKTRIVCGVGKSVGIRHQLWSGCSYNSDPQVDCSVCEEPVHEAALGGHHVWVALSLLHFPLAVAECGAIVLGAS